MPQKSSKKSVKFEGSEEQTEWNYNFLIPNHLCIWRVSSGTGLREKKRFHLSKPDSWISIQHIQPTILARRSLKWWKIHQLIHAQAEYKENDLLSGMQRVRRANRDGADTAHSWLTAQVTHHHLLKRGRILQGSHDSCFNQEKSHHCLDQSLREGMFSGRKGREGQGCRYSPAPNSHQTIQAPFYLQWRRVLRDKGWSWRWDKGWFKQNHSGNTAVLTP